MKVLIIGLGSIAQKHISALRTLYPGDIQIYALRSSGIRPSDATDIVSITSIEEAGISFDFAIVSNPTFAHFATLKSLLYHNIPLFIEKPLFHTLEGGQAVIDEINQRNLTSYVACNLRFHPCIVFLKDLAINNPTTINEVNVYAGSYLPDWRPGVDFKTVYSANRNMGGGVHLDLIHELDYVTWLWKQPPGVKRLLKSNSSLGIDAVDYANYLLDYDRFVVSITLNYYRRDTKRMCEIVFCDKTVVMDLVRQEVRSNGELLFSSNISPEYTYVEQMKYFISSLKNNNKPLMNNIQEAFNVLQICLGNE